MNILLDKLPENYKGLKINTNFRSFILFELLMQDKEISQEDKIALSIDLFYAEFPKDLKLAFEGILWFYGRGKEQKKEEKEQKNSKERIYSYEHDADHIYTAFKHDYGIDLNDIEYLHWFKFKSLFEDLNDENRICQIMGYRAIDLSKIKDKDEKKRYKRLKQQYALPDERTEEEKENDFAEAFW